MPNSVLFVVCAGAVLLSGEVAAAKTTAKPGPTLRFMTFNTWHCGRMIANGDHKMIKHINLLKPDIISLQEVDSVDDLNGVVSGLDGKWNAYIPKDRGVAILTKHAIKETADVNAATYARVQTSLNLTLNVWAVHLDYKAYGPYAACNKMTPNISVILQGETQPYGEDEGRVLNMREILSMPEFVAKNATANIEPLIMAGDFNSPSHLDWTADLKDLNCGWAVEWPATKMPADHGLVDSFREVNPNARRDPGITWTPVSTANDMYNYKVAEKMDRIDFILYKGGSLRPVRSERYGGTEALLPYPNHTYNDWPSDHYAVVTDFVINK